MPITIEKLKATVRSFQEKRSDNNNEWPKCTFLPEGNHKVRFITDPSDEVMIDYWAYGYFSKGHRDPRDLPSDQLPQGFVDELGKFYNDKLKPLEQWRLGPKKVVLAYVYLYETDAPNENWQPDNLYVIITGNKFQEAYTNFLSILAKDAPEEIIKMLNAGESGVQLQLAVKGGNQGSVSIGAAFPTKHVGPIDISKFPYVPLETAYIKPVFNKEKYDNLLVAMKEAYAKATATPAPEASTETLGSKPTESPNLEGNGQSMLSTTKAEAAPAQEAKAEEKPLTEATPAETAVVSTQAQPSTESSSSTGSVWDKFKRPVE